VSRLVVDASVVLKWFLPEALSEAALRLAASDRVFLAPELLGAEVANALWKKQLRREVEGTYAAGILENLRRVAIETFTLMPLLPAAFAIASAAGHSVYDCLYLALADRENCPVVTADRRFHQAFAGGHLGHRMLWIESLDP
jgi:predicted nucleic acid-binding protein